MSSKTTFKIPNRRTTRNISNPQKRLRSKRTNLQNHSCNSCVPSSYDSYDDSYDDSCDDSYDELLNINLNDMPNSKNSSVSVGCGSGFTYNNILDAYVHAIKSPLSCPTNDGFCFTIFLSPGVYDFSPLTRLDPNNRSIAFQGIHDQTHNVHITGKFQSYGNKLFKNLTFKNIQYTIGVQPQENNNCDCELNFQCPPKCGNSDVVDTCLKKCGIKYFVNEPGLRVNSSGFDVTHHDGNGEELIEHNSGPLILTNNNINVERLKTKTSFDRVGPVAVITSNNNDPCCNEVNNLIINQNNITIRNRSNSELYHFVNLCGTSPVNDSSNNFTVLDGHVTHYGSLMRVIDGILFPPENAQINSQANLFVSQLNANRCPNARLALVTNLFGYINHDNVTGYGDHLFMNTLLPSDNHQSNISFHSSSFSHFEITDRPVVDIKLHGNNKIDFDVGSSNFFTRYQNNNDTFAFIRSDSPNVGFAFYNPNTYFKNLNGFTSFSGGPATCPVVPKSFVATSIDGNSPPTGSIIYATNVMNPNITSASVRSYLQNVEGFSPSLGVLECSVEPLELLEVPP